MTNTNHHIFTHKPVNWGFILTNPDTITATTARLTRNGLLSLTCIGVEGSKSEFNAVKDGILQVLICFPLLFNCGTKLFPNISESTFDRQKYTVAQLHLPASYWNHWRFYAYFTEMIDGHYYWILYRLWGERVWYYLSNRALISLVLMMHHAF